MERRERRRLRPISGDSSLHPVRRSPFWFANRMRFTARKKIAQADAFRARLRAHHPRALEFYSSRCTRVIDRLHRCIGSWFRRVAYCVRFQLRNGYVFANRTRNCWYRLKPRSHFHHVDGVNAVWGDLTHVVQTCYSCVAHAHVQSHELCH